MSLSIVECNCNELDTGHTLTYKIPPPIPSFFASIAAGADNELDRIDSSIPNAVRFMSTVPVTCPLNSNLKNISSTTLLPTPCTGTYGSYVDVITGSIIYGKVAILIFSGQVTGIVDINLTAFGIDESRRITQSLASGAILAKNNGIGGGTLHVKGWPTGYTLQLSSSVDNGIYTVIIPLLLQ